MLMSSCPRRAHANPSPTIPHQRCASHATTHSTERPSLGQGRTLDAQRKTRSDGSGKHHAQLRRERHLTLRDGPPRLHAYYTTYARTRKDGPPHVLTATLGEHRSSLRDHLARLSCKITLQNHPATSRSIPWQPPRGVHWMHAPSGWPQLGYSGRRAARVGVVLTISLVFIRSVVGARGKHSARCSRSRISSDRGCGPDWISFRRFSLDGGDAEDLRRLSFDVMWGRSRRRSRINARLSLDAGDVAGGIGASLWEMSFA